MTNSMDNIKAIVTEISDGIYENSYIDLEKYKELEPIISGLRYETELIITEVINTLLSINK